MGWGNRERLVKGTNFQLQDEQGQDFPSGPVVKNPPSNAGDSGSMTGQGTKIPHAKGQGLSLLALEPVFRGKRSPCSEAREAQWVAAKESCVPQWRPSAAKKKKKKKKDE